MRIVITGATSGLGAALAKAYAAPGMILALTGRDEARLAAVADICRQRGADVVSVCLDVTEKQAMADWLTTLGSVDMVIANAGISAGTGGDGESEVQARRIFATNLDGVLNTIYPLLGRVKHIVLMSSLAGFRGMPGAPAYSASKGAVRMLGEALRPELAPQGIAVTVVCPGFVRTPMTAVNNFPMPFMMEADEAAQLIKRRLGRKPAQIAFPLPVYLGMQFLAFLPVSWGSWLLAKAPKKPAN